jgi:hypothetical protein
MIENKPAFLDQPDRMVCPECGAAVDGGRAGCQAVWDELAARAYQNPAYASSYNLAFDTYCMQHPAKYCRSAKSYAAHLTRLCCGIEFNGDPDLYAAIQKWLNGSTPVEKPPLLARRGSLTVVELRSAANAAEYRVQVQVWAKNVWAAYASQHDLARRWIETARQVYAKKENTR